MNSENKNSFGYIYRTIKLKKDKKLFVKSFLNQLKSVMNNNEEAYNNESNEIKKIEILLNLNYNIAVYKMMNSIYTNKKTELQNNFTEFNRTGKLLLEFMLKKLENDGTITLINQHNKEKNDNVYHRINKNIEDLYTIFIYLCDDLLGVYLLDA
jgi:hypothetical protein